MLELEVGMALPGSRHHPSAYVDAEPIRGLESGEEIPPPAADLENTLPRWDDGATDARNERVIRTGLPIPLVLSVDEVVEERSDAFVAQAPVVNVGGRYGAVAVVT